MSDQMDFENAEQIGGAPDKDSRMWAMFCHLSTLANLSSIPFAGLILCLIIWQVKKEQHPFIDDQGKEALNFQLFMTALLCVGWLSLFICIGVFLLPLIAIVAFIMGIIGGIKANQGEKYRYPYIIRFIN